MRSATEPATSATVMIAKVIWYIMNSISGMVLAAEWIVVQADAAQEQPVEIADDGFPRCRTRGCSR